MIVSASRRTDIPAFYLPWMLERLRQGYALARNPHNPRQIRRIPLNREETDCIVFWTKDGSELLRHLDEVEGFGIPFYVQWTLTSYGPDLEPNVPDKRVLAENFRALARRIGPRRLVWRYDPVLIYGRYTDDRHIEAFDRLCRRFSGATDTCIFSFVDLYAKTRRALPALHPVSPEEMDKLAAAFARIAGETGIALHTCCEGDFHRFGIGPAACIDRVRMEEIVGHPMKALRDSGQRPGCGCVQSADIGAYGTCFHGCAYCYATGPALSTEHRPDSPLLTGKLGPEEMLPPECRQMSLFAQAGGAGTSDPGFSDKQKTHIRQNRGTDR